MRWWSMSQARVRQRVPGASQARIAVRGDEAGRVSDSREPSVGVVGGGGDGVESVTAPQSGSSPADRRS
jgi:hypothetical protein